MQFKRYELKYYLNEVQMEGLIQQLSHIMSIDKHSNGLSGYNVRSLYFDSINDECLYQKQSGFLIRDKIRLRTYGDSTADSVKLEVKSKNNQFINKKSVLVSKDIASNMINGNYSPLLELQNPVSNWVYTTMVTRAYKPKVIVEYNRLAFVYPVSNLRITFDMNLRSNINHTNLFSSVNNSFPVVLEQKQIMEVKFEKFIPDHIKKILSGVATERSAISKYTLARRFNKTQKWEDN